MRIRRKYIPLLVNLLLVAALLVGRVVHCFVIDKGYDTRVPPTEWQVDVTSRWLGPIAFTTDSGHLYFAEKGQLSCRTVGGTEMSPIPLPGDTHSIAIANRTFLFIVDDGGICRMADMSAAAPWQWTKLENRPGYRSDSVAASPTGECVALVSGYFGSDKKDNYALEIFPAAEPGSRKLLMTTDVCVFYPPSFSRDGRFLVWYHAEEKAVKVWESGSGRLVRAVLVPESYVHGWALSSDGAVVAFGGGNERIWVYSVPDGTQVGEWRMPDAVNHVAFHPDGSLVVACEHSQLIPFALGVRKATLTVLEPSSGKEKSFTACRWDGVRELMVSPNGRFVAISGGKGGDESVRLWRWEQLVP